MRILYFADIRFPLERANGIQTTETCHALAMRGHEVTLVVRPDTASPAREPLAFYGLPPVPGLTIAPVEVGGPPARRRMQYLRSALAWAIGRRGSDLVFTRDLGVASAVLRLPAPWRPPVVYESHGYAPVVGQHMPDMMAGARRAGWFKQWRLATRERRTWQRADGYVTITAALKDELARRFGPRAYVAVVPDATRFRPASPFNSGSHARPVIGYAGHLYPWKGVDVLLEALVLLPEVEALIVGGRAGDRELPAAQALARSLGLEPRVRFTGWVAPSDVPRTLDAAGVLVLPTRATAVGARYTSPLKLFDYLALGRPIVASDLPALREVLVDGVNAVLVEPDSPARLADGIRRVLETPGLAERLARGALETAGDYTWARRAERLERLFKNVVEEPARR